MTLVADLIAQAERDGQFAIQAMCRDGLDANLFWRDAGFIEICRLDNQACRSRDVICWRYPLSTINEHNFKEVEKWFFEAPKVAGYQARRTA